jgi:tyrosyl-tRNA synthetase
MGGSDQWGNITSGTEFIRRNIPGAKAYAITSPLLTKSDGKKFGKSEEGNIWLDPQLTSPYKFYQFWINADDADVSRFLRFFSLKSRKEIEELESTVESDPREAKKSLAEELTIRIHSQEDYRRVMDVSEILFNKHAGKDQLYQLDSETLEAVGNEIPRFDIPKEALGEPVNIIDLLSEVTSIASSKGDARRAIKNNAISVNKEKVSDFNQPVGPESLLHGRFIMVENGRKNKYLIQISGDSTSS